MLRFRLYYNKDKACQWLDRMSDQGWAVRWFGAGIWDFERCTPGEYRYAMDFGGTLGSRGEYTDFMQSVGVTVVGHWGPWTLLRQPASNGPFRLYSDTASAVAQQKRILRFFKIMCIIELVCFCMLCLVAAELSYAWWALLLTGVAGLISIIFARRCFELRDSICQLEAGTDGSGAAVRQRRQWTQLLAAGFLLTLAALLLKIPYQDNAFTDFLMGCGCGLEVLSAIRLIS